MTALALEKNKLSYDERLLKESILDHILGNFCKDCPALFYEQDTGSCDCPCGDDPDSNQCHRGQDWAFINEYAEEFISNIRGCW